MTYSFGRQRTSGVDPFHSKHVTHSAYATQTLKVQGIPRIEYRSEPSVQTEICICLKPTYSDDEYGYSKPKFVWGDEVLIGRQYEESGANPHNYPELCQVYRINAVELVEPVLKGMSSLYEAPYWLYGIRGVKGEQGLTWFDETELVMISGLENNIEF